MKKPFLAMLLSVLLLVPLASSAAFHDGWHASGNDFTIGGNEYYMMHEYGDDKALLTANGKSFLIREGKCAEDISFEYCVTEIDQDINSSRVTYSGGTPIASIHLVINKIGAEVSVSKSVGKAGLELDETTKVTITITNSGNRPVSFFEYTEKYPQGLRVLEAQSGNAFYAKGSLQAGQSRTLEYTVKAEDYVSEAVQGNLTYETGGSRKTLNSQAVKITVNAPYEIEVETDKDQVNVGDTLTYELSIGNEYDGELTVKSVEISYSGFTVKEKSNMTDSLNGLTWSGFLDKDASKEFKLLLEAENTGTNQIKAIVRMETAEEESLTFTEVAPIQVGMSKADPAIEFIPPAADSSSEIRVKAFLENTADVRVSLEEASLTLFGKEFKATPEKVQPGDKDTIFDEVLTSPETLTENGYAAVFTGRYTTPAGERFDFSDTATITIRPKPDAYEVIVNAPEAAGRGRQAGIEVKARNFLDQEMTVEARDSLSLSPSDTFLLEGNTSGTATLPPGGEETLYSYYITIPESFSGNKVIIKTKAKAGTLEIEQESVIEVHEAISEDIGSGETFEEGEEEGGPGLFTRMISGIGGFFSWLFG